MANGNITATVSGTSDSDGKIAKENAEKKEKEQKEKEEKQEKKRAEKKVQEEHPAERRAEKKAETNCMNSYILTLTTNQGGKENDN